MGGVQSVLTGQVSADSKNIINFIGREIFRRVDLMDMYSLADPERCKSYIIGGADVLSKMFASVNLYPEKGTDGRVYFQSIKGMEHTMGATQRAESTKLCNELSFFFNRTVQIAGALIISIIDSDVPDVDPLVPVKSSITRRNGRGYVNPVGPQGFTTPGQTYIERRDPRGSWRGGALRGAYGGYAASRFWIPDTSPYRILNKYLSEPPRENPAAPLVFERYIQMKIPQGGLYSTDAAGRLTLIDPPTVTILYAFREDKVYTLNATLTIEADTDEVKVQLKGFRITPAPIGVVGAAVDSDEISLEGDPDGYSPPVDQKGNELPAVLMRLFAKATESFLGTSSVQLLKDLRYIDADQDNTVIRGTRVTIDSPKRDFRKPLLSITFRDTLSIDKRQRSVEMKCELAIKRTKVGTEDTYTVTIDFNRLAVNSDAIKSMIELPTSKKYEAIFKASTSTSEPVRGVKRQTIPAFIQACFDYILKPVKSGKMTSSYRYTTRKGIMKPYSSERIPEQMRIDSLWKGWAKDPPIKAHCIARAMQLINLAGIRGNMSASAYSSVCNLKFPYILDKSLPTPGQSITSSDGIAAMVNLFYDTIDGAVPKISETPKYQEFVQRMGKAFHALDSDGVLTGNPSIDTLKEYDITSSDKPICAGADGKAFVADNSIRSQIAAKANMLVQMQGRHISNVMRILFELLDERKIRAGVFELHPKVLAGGMSELKRIGVKARELLIEYYSSCQETFNEGRIILNDYYKAKARDRSTVNTVVGASSATAEPNENSNEPDVNRDYDEDEDE